MQKMLAAALMLAAPLTTQAEDWQYSVMPYLWLPSISMDSPDFNSSGSIIDVGPTNYLDALKFGFMLDAEMRNNDLVFKGDLIYLDFAVDNKEIDLTPDFDLTNRGSYDFDLTGHVITLSGGKTVVRKDDYYMDALLGWRRFDMTAELEVIEPPVPNIAPSLSPGQKFKSNLQFNDVFVAVNGNYQFAGSSWSMPYYADIGTGDSDLTWQAMIGVDYAFGWGKLHMSYRHLDYDFGNVGNFTDLQTTFSGPTIGAKFEF